MENSHANKRIYEFEGFCLDAGEHELTRGSKKIALTNKAIELLTILVERHGQIVTREEILDNVWHDTFVDESNLTVTVSMLRRAFGIKAKGRRFIETVPKRGYRFNATVRTADELVIERHSLTQINITEIETSTPRYAALTRIVRGRPFATAAISVAVLALLAGGIHVGRGGSLSPGFLITEAKASPTIAVMPFVVSASRLGMTNTAQLLSNSIADDLAVGTPIVRAEAMKSEGATIHNFLIIGKKLRADAVLIGTLFDDPADIYVRVHLVSTANGNVLWARTFREPVDAASSVTGEIAENIRGNLPGTMAQLGPDEQTTRSTESREAETLYVQGRFIWRNRFDVFGAETESKEHLEAALRIDPNFALPMIALADWQKTNSHDSEDRKQAEEYLRRALEISPRSADAHASLGFIRMVHDWNWKAAEQEFQTALEIDPKCVNALRWSALMSALQTRHKEAGQKVTLALQYEPFSITLRRDAAEFALLRKNYGGAVEGAMNIEFEVPGSAGGILTDSLWQKGEHALAVKYLAAGSVHVIAPERFAARLAEQGPNGVAELMLERYGRDKKYDLWPSYWQAQWFAYLNEREKALDLLERAADEHHFFMIWIKAEPFFENLQGEPRYQNLLKRVGLDD